MFKLVEGQTVKLNHDVEIWNEDDSLAARIEAGTDFLIVDICLEPAYTGDSYNVDVKAISNVYGSYTTNVDISEDDIA